jgi:recombination protein RecA
MVRLSLLTLVLAWKGVSSFTVPPLRSATTASVDSSSISSSRKSSNNSSSRLYLARRKSSAEDPKDKSDDSAESSAKKAALDGVLNQIERAYGRGSVMRLGDAGQMKVSMISTGSLTLDAATGGGYPRGRVVEIYGPESSGKTTLALHAIAQVQKEGGTAAFIDAEHALDPAYAAGCGVMVDDLLVSQPDSGEMALDVVDQLVRSAAVDVIVVDSVAALVPRAELEGDMSDTQIGLQARLMSKAMRKITGSLALSQCTVIFLNQLRSKVGVIYGSPEVTSGGNALKFYASIRLDTRRKEIMADNAGIRIKVKVVKNKVAAPFKVVMLDVLFGSGVDFWGGMLDAAVELEVVQRRGSWYAYRGENLAQGRPRCIELIKADPKLAEIMEADVRAAMANIGGEANDEPIAPAAVAETGVSEEISAPATASLTEETSYLE